MTTTTAASGGWMTAEQFAAEQRRLRRLLASRYRALSDADIDDIVAETLVKSWQDSTLPDGEIANTGAWLSTVALNAARRHLIREHDRHDSLDDERKTIEHRTASTVGAGRQPLAEDLTAAQVALNDRFRARGSLIAGLRRIRPLDVDIFLEQSLDGPTYRELAERRGITLRRTRKAMERVANFLTRVSGLVDRHDLDEHDAIALALHHANAATAAEREIAERLLARPDGPQLQAAVADAFRHAKAYLPVLVGAQDPARVLTAPLSAPDSAPTLWQRIIETLAAARHQVAQWTATGKDTAAHAAAQYLPAGTGARPGAAIGAALALCIGSATVCVDQGVIPNPLRAGKPAPRDQAVKAPKPLRQRRAAKVTAPGRPAAATTSKSVRLRAPAPPTPDRGSASSPASAPAATPNGGGGGSSNEFGGSTSEFGGGSTPATTGAGNEFGGGSSPAAGGGSSGGGGGGGGEFGAP